MPELCKSVNYITVNNLSIDSSFLSINSSFLPLYSTLSLVKSPIFSYMHFGIHCKSNKWFPCFAINFDHSRKLKAC